MKTYRRLQMLTSFLPRFLPGATTHERTFVLMVTPPTVTWSPVQPRSLDFVQPGVGLLSGFHLDGASVTELTVTVLAPPGGGVRGKHFDRQMKKESTLKLFISSRKTPRKVHLKIQEVLLGGPISGGTS